MDAIAIEFMTESMLMYVREFYASRMGTHPFLSKEAVTSGLTYSELFVREREAEWEKMVFPFDSTPAIWRDDALNIEEIIYNAGDGPRPGEKDLRLLKYGKQEVIKPGSIFRAVLWGERVPAVEKGQPFFIGKKRGSCVITFVTHSENIILRNEPSGTILPIQLNLDQISRFPSYIPLATLSRFLIVKIPAGGWGRWLNVGGFSVPVP